MLIGKIAPGAAQPTLDFVENQQRSGPVAQLPGGLQELGAEWPDSALALNRLQANGADAAIKLPLQIVNVVKRNEPHARNQRRKGMPIFFLPGRGQRAEGASVKRIFQRQ